MKRVISMLLVLVICMCLPCAALAVESPGNDGAAPTVPSTDVPNTGDTSAINIWFAVMLIALLALVVIIVCYRKFAKR